MSKFTDMMDLETVCFDLGIKQEGVKIIELSDDSIKVTKDDIAIAYFYDDKNDETYSWEKA